MSSATGFVHKAAFYGSDKELLDFAVPFVTEGLNSDEWIAVVSTKRNNELLKRRINDNRVVTMDSSSVYKRPAATISHFVEFVEQASRAGVGVRVIGEVNFLGRHPGSHRNEWIKYEALVNEILADTPCQSICPYDYRNLSADVIASAMRTHPFVLTSSGSTSNPNYERPEYVARDVDSAKGPDPLESRQPDISIYNLTDIAELRRRIYVAATGIGMSFELVGDFVLAVSEVARNALVHGRPPVSVDMWAVPHQLLCCVTDRGQGFSDLFSGYRNPRAEEMSSAGHWIARQLCDRFDTQVVANGFKVRMSLWN